MRVVGLPTAAGRNLAPSGILAAMRAYSTAVRERVLSVAERGEPGGRVAEAYGKAPRNTQVNTTLIASMSAAGMGPAMVLTGATDAPASRAHTERVLCPSLEPGEVVVMDNLGAHTRGRIRELIEARGCEVWRLPSYSPDLSPIEEASPELKALLRRAQARTREALEAAIGDALDAITPADAAAYLAHCGYGTRAQ
jgi:transposase